MAAPSVCHQFARHFIHFEADYFQVTLDVRVPIDRIGGDNEQGSELDVKLEPCSKPDVTPTLHSLQELDELLEESLRSCLEESLRSSSRTLHSLQELDELLEESLRSSSHSQEKRNESEFASGIQDLVQPLRQITVYIYGQKSGQGLLEHFPDAALLELVVKFRTRLHMAFSGPEVYAALWQTAIHRDYVGPAKLAVAVEALRISNNSCFCPATVMAKVMKCASTLEIVTLLLEICPDSPFHQRNVLRYICDPLALWECSIKDQYTALFHKHIGTLPHFWKCSGCLDYAYGGTELYDTELYDTMKWFGNDITTSYHQNQVPGVWNLTAEVHGLLLTPVHGLRPTRHACWPKSQVLKLQVSLQTAVTGACSTAIGVRNVQVRIQNASLDSSPSNFLGFFLSHITLSIRPKVEGQQVLLMLLEVPSPNEPYDISATRTIGVSATATGSENPGVAVTATESSSATIKSTTTDWRHEQTRGDEFTGNFSWTLRRLAGVPFDHVQPKCPKMSIFRRRPVTSMLELPFNSDGSVTFSEQCPKTIQWTLAPELAGTDMAWYVSTTVHVTMLNRSTGQGKTLEFWSPHHFLHNMSTNVECTHS